MFVYQIHQISPFLFSMILLKGKLNPMLQIFPFFNRFNVIIHTVDTNMPKFLALSHIKLYISLNFVFTGCLYLLNQVFVRIRGQLEFEFIKYCYIIGMLILLLYCNIPHASYYLKRRSGYFNEAYNFLHSINVATILAPKYKSSL